VAQAWLEINQFTSTAADVRAEVEGFLHKLAVWATGISR
jgi:hypothetical protein